MNVVQAVVLGVVEGVTEFLPVSSTGHLLIAEKLLGLKQGDSLIGFTAVIQVGAILAAVVFFAKDIVELVRAFFGGLFTAQGRHHPEFRFALAVGIGSIPIALVGLALRNVIKTIDMQLVTVALGLIVFSAVFVFAEQRAAQDRAERSLTLLDGLLIGLAQCLALVPGVSRSGATISAGLLRGLDRVSATRLSFLLGIPALIAAGLYELKDASSGGTSKAAIGLSTVVAFVVAYVVIAFLLRFVASHKITAFVPYRVALGVVVLAVVGVQALN